MLGQSTPASNGGGRAGGGIGARGGESGIADGGAGGDGSGEFPDSDVVIEGRAGEAGVNFD